jgi:hypothetical protein
MKIAWECTPSIHFKRRIDWAACVFGTRLRFVWIHLSRIYPCIIVTATISTPLVLCDWDCSQTQILQKQKQKLGFGHKSLIAGYTVGAILVEYTYRINRNLFNRLNQPK